jgi:uncharacterized protein DUF3618
MSLPAEHGRHAGSSRPADRYRVKASAIAHDIEQTRRKIDETLSALTAKLSPGQALNRARTVMKQHPLETALVVVALITGLVWHTAVRGRPRR